MELTLSMPKMTPWGEMGLGNVTYAAAHKHQLLAVELEGHSKSNTGISNPLFLGHWECSDKLRVTSGSVITGQKMGGRDATEMPDVFTVFVVHIAYLLECEIWVSRVYLYCLLPQSNVFHLLVLPFETGTDECCSLYGI